MVDWPQAKQFWRDGLDTFDIAKHFGVHESVIYNGLNGAWARKGNADDVPGARSQGMLHGLGDQIHISGSKEKVNHAAAHCRSSG